MLYRHVESNSPNVMIFSTFFNAKYFPYFEKFLEEMLSRLVVELLELSF